MEGSLHNAALSRHGDCIPKGPFHQLEGLLVLALGLQEMVVMHRFDVHHRMLCTCNCQVAVKQLNAASYERKA